MGLMNYVWKNNKRDIDIKQYVYYISSYHYNWHNELELITVLQGEIEVSINGSNYILEEDDMMLINSNVGHATLARKSNSIAMVIHLNPIYFSSYYSDYHLLQFTCRSYEKTRYNEDFNCLRKLIFEMIQYIKGDAPSEKIYFECLLSQLAANLIINFSPKKISSMEMASNKKKTDAVNKIITYIENNYKNKISLEELSLVSGYHKSYISQIVKQQLGINYYEYLTRIRLREATYALSDFDEKISDIALSYGFSDVKSFNTAFRNSFGKTPSEYRKQLSSERTLNSELREKRYLEDKEFYKLISNKKGIQDTEMTAQEKDKEEKTLSEEDFQSLNEISKSLENLLLRIQRKK
ncbi:AraC family transcriptional regulator [Lysinibacillus telephonicus]|uniref:AraC family transcriptional regulator n=1 Tax=Lysinibacillus telephonicus TaxID=1714840 RepID=A0A3S0J058_9BACI|nr:AraC family transcriptional regulator [Lysinibacillus telephonicus]RTQ90958.1 AraC family transcriptional regulator [Lysinibacillus telephonicus]